MNVIETARRILLLEQREGFRDRAVVGGLDGFLEQVRAVALPTLEPADREQLVHVIEPLDGYSRANPRDRRSMLEAALQAVGEALVEQRAAPPKPAPSSSTAGPAKPTGVMSGRGLTQGAGRPDGGAAAADAESANRGSRPAVGASPSTTATGPNAQSTAARAGEATSAPEGAAGFERSGNAALGYLERAEDSPASARSRGLAGAPTRTTASTRRKVAGGGEARGRAAGTRGVAKVSALDLDVAIERVPGVSSGLAPRLRKLGIDSPRQLLEHLPSRHIDRTSMTPIDQVRPSDEQVTIIGTIWDVRNERRRGSMTLTTATIVDHTGNVTATWFNQPYLARTLHAHAQVMLSGKVELFRGRPQFTSPEWELVTDNDSLHAGRIVPVYPLTEGLHQKQLRTLLKRAVDTYAPLLDDHLPEDLRRAADLMSLSEAVAEYHFPDSWQALEQAKRRLAFDELFLIQLTAQQRRRQWQEGQSGIRLQAEPGWLDEVIARLPFKLTGAQRKVLADVAADMASGRPMNRLVQGDVGSGKTVVAALAMYLAVHEGYQTLLMAPTEILAEQHYRSLGSLFATMAGKEEASTLDAAGTPLFEALGGDGPRAPRVALLTGSSKSRRQVLQGLADGSVNVAAGTQALIQEGVEVARLGLAVVDEQHRFGVQQRGALRQKGFNPHLLVMTATPIPRTLGLTIYGDLDISTIDEMPPGRQPIKTKWFPPDERKRAYEFMRRQVQEGRQAFVICPLIEESEKMEVRAATAEYERLHRLVFPEFKLGLLHGRLKNREKDEVMQAFGRNEIQILVSTSVVEVGIDVPNATVMAIEGAERFGLAQLHQFRGRVGRGQHQSYCMLLSDSPAQELNPRLRAIEETQNGFRLAEIDLELRGPGELFGTRQSGLLELKVAKLTDVELIEETRRLAGQLLDRDPELEHAALLRGRLATFWQDTEVS